MIFFNILQGMTTKYAEYLLNNEAYKTLQKYNC